MSRVFVTGGTGYIGSRLIRRLSAGGHAVRALVRPASRAKLTAGKRWHGEIVEGDALDASSYVDALQGCDTFVHLVGVAHPSPARAAEFVSIDLASIEAAVVAAKQARVRHLIYVSVAQPAPVMQAYVDARRRGESLIRAARLNATVLRPWYVLGPGHRWPVILLPAYWLAACVPGARDTARRLGLVTLEQMLCALETAVARPAQGVRVMDVPAIKAAQRSRTPS
jgi:uncharacterized protein YbjT (DUF2867 family)